MDFKKVLIYIPQDKMIKLQEQSKERGLTIPVIILEIISKHL